MLDGAYLAECNIEVAKDEIYRMKYEGYTSFRLSYAIAAGRYWSIMLECHGGY